MSGQLAGVWEAVARRDVWLAAVITVVVIGIGVFFGEYNNRVVPINPAATAHYILEPANHFSYLSNWDGPQYLSIAMNGYRTTGPTNFFPLYPLLIYVVHFVVGSPLDSALLIAWVSFFGAVYFYLKIIKQLFNIRDNTEALRAVALFVFFPTAIFLFATYTEGLFACLALGAVYFALQKRYISAAVLLYFCTMAHITGMFVVVLAALILLEKYVDKVKVAATVIVGSLGLGTYMTFLGIKFHRPLAFIESQKTNHGWLGTSHVNLWSSANLVDLISLALVVAAVVYWWPRRKSFAVYAGLFVLIPLLGGQFGGFARYILMAFPIPWMFYDYLRDKKTLYGAVLILSVITWTYFLLQYAGGYVGG